MRTMTFAVALVVVTLAGIGAWISVPKTAIAQDSLLLVTAGDGLNVRTCPSLDCDVVDVLEVGSLVVDYGRSDDGEWVLHDGGWSFGDWLSGTEPIPEGRSATGYVETDYCVDSSWGSTDCAPPWIAEAIFSAAAEYGQDPWYMLRIAACESHFDPYAVGAMGEIGLFQIFPDEYAEYGVTDAYDVWDASYATARQFSLGNAWRWTCASRI